MILPSLMARLHLISRKKRFTLSEETLHGITMGRLFFYFNLQGGWQVISIYVKL